MLLEQILFHKFPWKVKTLPFFKINLAIIQNIVAVVPTQTFRSSSADFSERSSLRQPREQARFGAVYPPGAAGEQHRRRTGKEDRLEHRGHHRHKRTHTAANVGNGLMTTPLQAPLGFSNNTSTEMRPPQVQFPI